MTAKGYALTAGGSLLLLAASFVAGRYTAPTKTVETVKTVETKVVDQDAIAKAVAFAQAEWKRDVQVKTTVRTIYKDGKPSERIVYRDRESQASGSSTVTASTTAETKTHEATTATTEKSKTVETARASWAVQAHAGWGAVSTTPDQYGGEIQFRLLGPVWAGVGADKTDKVRPTASLRMEF